MKEQIIYQTEKIDDLIREANLHLKRTIVCREVYGATLDTLQEVRKIHGLPPLKDDR
jgi:hypothetical protein